MFSYNYAGTEADLLSFYNHYKEYFQNDKNYNLIAEIYEVLGNKELSKKLLNLNSRLIAANSLKDELSGIYRKND